MSNTVSPLTKEYLNTITKELPRMKVNTENSTFILVITAIMDSPCLARIINLKIFAFIFTIFIVVDALILYLNKPRYYIISIALYTLMGMGFMLHYKRSVINLHNKLDDNCVEEIEVKI